MVARGRAQCAALAGGGAWSDALFSAAVAAGGAGASPAPAVRSGGSVVAWWRHNRRCWSHKRAASDIHCRGCFVASNTCLPAPSHLQRCASMRPCSLCCQGWAPRCRAVPPARVSRHQRRYARATLCAKVAATQVRSAPPTRQLAAPLPLPFCQINHCVSIDWSCIESTCSCMATARGAARSACARKCARSRCRACRPYCARQRVR